MEEKHNESNQANNINRVKFFLQKTDNNKPILPSQVPITQLIRQYLNDDDFNIWAGNVSVFNDVKEEELIQKLYNEWAKDNELDVNSFIIYWISNSPHLYVQYSLYDDIGLNNQETCYSKSIRSLHISKNKSQPTLFKGQINPTCYSKKKKKQQISPKELLRKFFILYSKKQIGSNTKTFNQYQQQSNSLNLTKWMRYALDVGLTKYKKQITNTKLKQIFMKYQDNKKQLLFEQFQMAVQDALREIVTNDEEKIKNGGYKLIGIWDYQNFKDKFQQMGQIVPHYTKQSTKNKYSIHIGSTQAKIGKRSNILNTQHSHMKQHTIVLPKIKQSKLDHEQPNSTRSQVSFTKLNQHHESALIFRLDKKIVRERQQLLCSFINDEDHDPYLKRYNDKQNISNYRCVANRIDQRIQKICTKNDNSRTDQK